MGVLFQEACNQSLIAYPGGKQRGKRLIMDYFPTMLDDVVSPFIGGGSIEIDLASRGIRVYGYDLDPNLVNFWQIALAYPARLAERIRDKCPRGRLTREEFVSIRDNFDDLSRMDKAARFYILNRTAFMGSDGQRYGVKKNEKTCISQEMLRLVSDFELDNLWVTNMDFQESLANHPEAFAYLDPPYMLGRAKDKLYGNGKFHQDFPHDTLAEILEARPGPWVMSYNDCPWIRDRYSRYRIETPKWNYTMSATTESNEVLVINA